MGTEWMTELKSITLHVAGEPAPMWPDDASQEYRAARLALSEAERALRDQVRAVAEQRRALPPGPVLPVYELAEGPLDLSADGPVTSVTLAELFGEHKELVVYHMMFHPDDDASCPMCASVVDGLHGVSHHIAQRAALAVVGKAPIGKLRAWSRHRGWQGLRLVSAHDSSFNADLGVEGTQGGQWPAVSVFTRDGDQVRHAYTQAADFPDGSNGGFDLIWPLWNVLDLLPSGRSDWDPDNDYATALRGAQATTGTVR
ncbi:MAG: DUF899 family protein [Kutzneria sp.]|nr:DUF899 family protein [Kutzneria sp.]